MQFQIQKDRQALGCYPLLSRDAMRIEELHAGFHVTHMRFQRARQCNGPIKVGRIEGNADRVQGHDYVPFLLPPSREKDKFQAF